MFGTDTIRSMQDEAAEQAAAEHRIPFVYWDDDEISPDRFPFPSIGDYQPKGWERLDYFMVDSSGFGSPGEPADTPEQLVARIRREIAAHPNDTLGWAIIEIGQFQVVVGEFIKR